MNVIKQFPYVIVKINREYYIIDERNDFVYAIFDNRIDACVIAAKLNNKIEYEVGLEKKN